MVENAKRENSEYLGWCVATIRWNSFAHVSNRIKSYLKRYIFKENSVVRIQELIEIPGMQSLNAFPRLLIDISSFRSTFQRVCGTILATVLK